jgi:hypothetical protein
VVLGHAGEISSSVDRWRAPFRSASASIVVVSSLRPRWAMKTLLGSLIQISSTGEWCQVALIQGARRVRKRRDGTRHRLHREVDTVSTTFPPQQPGRDGWNELLTLVGAVRRIAYDLTLEPDDQMRRIRDEFLSYDRRWMRLERLPLASSRRWAKSRAVSL